MSRYKDKDKERATRKAYRAKHKDLLDKLNRAYLRTPKGRYSVLLSLAKSKGKFCNITIYEHEHLLKQPCHYCGGSLNTTSSGLDQVVPSAGYLLSNVVPCCKRCNQAKSNLTVEEFSDWIKVVYEHFVKSKCGF